MTDKQIFNKYLREQWPSVITKRDKEMIFKCIGFRNYILGVRLQECIDAIVKEFHPLVKILYKIIVFIHKALDKLNNLWR